MGGRWFFPGEEKEFDDDHRNDSPATRHASLHIQGLQPAASQQAREPRPGK